MSGSVADHGIPPEALPHWLHLLHAQAELTQPVPCQAEPEPFYARSRADRANAAAACQHCPLIQPCDTYATAARERHGVWGGTDRTPVQPSTARKKGTTEKP